MVNVGETPTQDRAAILACQPAGPDLNPANICAVCRVNLPDFAKILDFGLVLRDFACAAAWIGPPARIISDVILLAARNGRANQWHQLLGGLATIGKGARRAFLMRRIS
jgi:hypothetical protein